VRGLGSGPCPAGRRKNGGVTSDKVQPVNSRGEFESVSLRQCNPMGVEEGAHTAPTRDYTLKEALRSSPFWMLALSFFFFGVAHSTVTVHTVVLLGNRIRDRRARSRATRTVTTSPCRSA